MLTKGTDGVYRDNVHPDVVIAAECGVPLERQEPSDDDAEPVGSDSVADVADRVTPGWRQDERPCPFWPDAARAVSVSGTGAPATFCASFARPYLDRLWAAADYAAESEEREHQRLANSR